MLTESERRERLERLAKLDAVVATDRDKLIYRTKNGLDDGILRTFEQTGEMFNLTREAVRLIVRKLDTLIGC